MASSVTCRSLSNYFQFDNPQTAVERVVGRRRMRAIPLDGTVEEEAAAGCEQRSRAGEKACCCRPGRDMDHIDAHNAAVGDVRPIAAYGVEVEGWQHVLGLLSRGMGRDAEPRTGRGPRLAP